LAQGDIEARLRQLGYAHLPGAVTLALLNRPDAVDWNIFADSWNHLGQDLYMADGGRYRRRRHATFRLTGDIVERLPHQPHYQSRDYNPLNGDIQRWFEPVEPKIAANVVTRSIFRVCGSSFTHLSGFPHDHPWRVEFHQFRIEATQSAVGRPTPEGLHRDGVDWVFVMLIGRQNVAEGVTEIGSPDREDLGRFALVEPGDAILLDDHRILHGVTPITAIDATQPAYRDALVVTFVTETAANQM
jgi:hypothetical protein